MQVCLYGHEIVFHFIEALSDALSENGILNEIQYGYPISDIKNEVPTIKKYIDNLWIGVFHWLLEFPRRHISYNTESLLTRKDLPSTVLRPALQVWDYSFTNVEILRSHRIKQLRNAIWVPMGYSPVYERIEDAKKDIDILFYGIKTPRREKIINELTDKGCHVVWLKENYGEERDKFVARSKIVVSICKTEPEELKSNDFSRLSYLIANRVFTVSERIGDIKTETLWEDKIQLVDYDLIVEKCLYFRDKEKERLEITEEAYVFAKEFFNLRKMLPIDEVKKWL